MSAEPTGAAPPGPPPDLETAVAGSPHHPREGWTVTWVDRRRGIARLDGAGDGRGRRRLAIVEGHGSEWIVTLRGRRIPVSVRTRRERLLAAAEVAGTATSGPVVVKATLPGLVVAVGAVEGQEVEEGASLVTIEAMKMQNEVRAPRAGRVADVTVTAGRTVRSGEPLLRIE